MYLYTYSYQIYLCVYMYVGSLGAYSGPGTKGQSGRCQEERQCYHW